MTLTPADLDRIRNDQSPADPLTGQRVLLGSDYDKLETAARRALEIESALAFLAIVRGGNLLAAQMSSTSEVLGAARACGWPGLQSEGGKEQGEHG